MQQINVNKAWWDRSEQESDKINFPMRLFQFVDMLRSYPSKITLAGLEALLIIERKPGISIQELATHRDVAHSTMSKNIKILTTANDGGDGLVIIKRNQYTGKMGCYLSDVGHNLFERLELSLGAGLGSVDRSHSKARLMHGMKAFNGHKMTLVEIEEAVDKLVSDEKVLSDDRFSNLSKI